jgi:hypothetical protein
VIMFHVCYKNLQTERKSCSGSKRISACKETSFLISRTDKQTSPHLSTQSALIKALVVWFSNLPLMVSHKREMLRGVAKS